MSLLTAAARIAEEAEFDPDTVSPGVAGFIAFAALGIGIILLGFNLVRRLRRNSYRAEVREQIEQELAAQNGAVGTEAADPQAPVQPGRAEPDEPGTEPGGSRTEPGAESRS
ncbi:hypothetical protein ACWGOE_07535 [Leucobacter chromiiresistens]